MNIKDRIFLFSTYVKRFHLYLTSVYKLDDIPYNVSGKAFPKKGEILIDNDEVNYQFHGRGCTIYWNNVEIHYNIDASSVHQIMIGAYSMKRFIETSKAEVDSIEIMFEEITAILVELENEGVLMTRKPNNLGSWHINELWYEVYKRGETFTGWNKNNIN